MPIRRADGTLDQIVGLLDIAPPLERRPAGLSGGEKQRVTIGRALLASPRILLFDEPLASLDPGRKSEILFYVERLRDELRLAMVYVSHEIEEIVRLAERMVVMSDGRSVAYGPVPEIMARLDLKPMTGRFEGGAVLEAVVAGHDLDYGITTLAFDGGGVTRRSAEDLALAPGRPVYALVKSVAIDHRSVGYA